MPELVYLIVLIPILLLDLIPLWIHYRIFRKRISKRQLLKSFLLLGTVQFLLIYHVENLVPSGAWALGLGLLIPYILIPLILGVFLFAVWGVWLLYRDRRKLAIVLGSVWILAGALLFYTFFLKPAEQDALSFVVRIQDQHQQPVVGANLKVRGLRASRYFGDGLSLTFTSDERGIVRVSGYGRQAFIDKVEREGYEISLAQPSPSGYSRATEVLSLRNDGRSDPYWAAQGDYGRSPDYTEKQPLELTAWKIAPKSLTEDELKETRYAGKATSSLFKRLKTDSFRFFPKPGVERISLHGLTAVCDVDGELTDRDQFLSGEGWTYTLSAVDGGVQPAKGYFLYQAPEDGYQQELRIDVSAEEALDKNSNMREREERFYYRWTDKVTGKQLYGAGIVRIYPKHPCAATVLIRYKENSRSLYDPEVAWPNWVSPRQGHRTSR